jgi:hypothetical protein
VKEGILAGACVIATYLINSWGGCTRPVPRILDGIGRVNVGQGAVMIARSLGASLSSAIGGWMAQEIGYSAMFLILGSFALGPVALWLGSASVLEPACVRHDHSHDRRMAAALAGAR